MSDVLNFSRTLWNAESHFLPSQLVANLIDDTKGRLFEVTFLTRGDNMPRTMRARTGVTAWARRNRAAMIEKLKAKYADLINEPYVSEHREEQNRAERSKILDKLIKLRSRQSVQPYEPRDYGLLCVADMDKLDYRMISTESVTRLKVNGTIYQPNRGAWGWTETPAPKRRHVRTRSFAI